MDTKAPRKAYTRRASRVSTVEGKAIPLKATNDKLKQAPRKTEVERLTGLLDDARYDYEQSYQAAGTLRTELNEAKAESKEQAALIKALQTQRDTFEQQRNDARRAQSMVAGERDDFIGKYQDEYKTSQALRNDAATLRGMLAAAETNIANFSKAVTLKNEVIGDLVRERDEAIEAKEHFEAATRLAEANRNEAIRIGEQLAAERDGLRRELDDTRGVLAASQANERALGQEVKRLREGWGAEVNAKVEAENIIAGLRKDLEGAGDELVELRGIRDDRDMAEREHDKKAKELEDTKEALVDLRDDLARMKVELAGYQDVEVEWNEAREELEQVKAKWGNAESNLSQVCDELQQAKEAIAKDRAEIARLHEVRLDAMKDAREDSRQQEQEAHQRTQEVASLRQQLAEIDSTLVEVLTSRNNLINQRRELITERDTYRRVIDILASKLG